MFRKDGWWDCDGAENRISRRGFGVARHKPAVPPGALRNRQPITYYVRNGYTGHGYSMPSPEPQSLLPLTPAVLHILLAVSDDRNGKHGYAIAREIEALTDGQIAMGPGTLYGSIQRMLDANLIEDVPRASRRARLQDDDERRRYYRSTALGRRVLSLELSRLAAIVDVARRKQLLPA